MSKTARNLAMTAARTAREADVDAQIARETAILTQPSGNGGPRPITQPVASGSRWNGGVAVQSLASIAEGNAEEVSLISPGSPPCAQID